MKGSNEVLQHGVPRLHSKEVLEDSIPQGSSASVKWPREVLQRGPQVKCLDERGSMRCSHEAAKHGTRMSCSNAVLVWIRYANKAFH